MQVYMGYTHYVCAVCDHYLHWMNDYLYRAGHRRRDLLNCSISRIVVSLVASFHYSLVGIVTLEDHWSFACFRLIPCEYHLLNHSPTIGNPLLLAQTSGSVLVIRTFLVHLVLEPLFYPQNLWIDSLVHQSSASSPSFPNLLSFVGNSNSLEELLDFFQACSRRRLCCCFGQRWNHDSHQIQWPLDFHS